MISQVSSTDTEENSLIVQGLTAFLLGLCMLYNTNQIETYTMYYCCDYYYYYILFYNYFNYYYFYLSDKLKDTIKKRIGIEQFEAKLEFISQHETYTKTLKKPTFAFKCKQGSDLLFDYEFTRLFKSNESIQQKNRQIFNNNLK